MGFFSRFASKHAANETAVEPANESQVTGNELAILSPVSGTVVALESTSDPAFSGRAMGDGVAVVPSAGEVVAPVSGTVGAIFPTGHAFAVATDDGRAQVMVHIGIETVRMEGEGFAAHVSQGDRVRAGQPVVSVDFEKVAAAGYDPTTFVVVCERVEGTSVRECPGGSVSAGDEVLWLS